MNLYDYKAQKEFSQKHLLRLSDYTSDEIFQVLSLALRLKEYQKYKQEHKLLKDKILAMIFTKSSTRTRVSFEAGIYQLGGTAQFLSSSDIQLGRGEPIADTAKVLSRMVDGIMIRTFAQKDVEDLARYGSIPVINGLTDLLHPCQILADLLTYYENFNSFEGKMAYVGDGNNVANSLLVGCAKVGLDIAVACPKGFGPDQSVLADAKIAAKNSEADIVVTTDPIEAAEGATAVYTDVWASMGQEADAEEIAFSKPLPAVRGVPVHLLSDVKRKEPAALGTPPLGHQIKMLDQRPNRVPAPFVIAVDAAVDRPE